jgi:hypothetical protein
MPPDPPREFSHLRRLTRKISNRPSCDHVGIIGAKRLRVLLNSSVKIGYSLERSTALFSTIFPIISFY